MAKTRSIDVATSDLVSVVNRLRKQTGKASVTDIADELGLSRSTCHRRLQEAVEDGVLTVLGPGGYSAPLP
jgi:DNA-binding IclR family transcriptional regulator